MARFFSILLFLQFVVAGIASAQNTDTVPQQPPQPPPVEDTANKVQPEKKKVSPPAVAIKKDTTPVVVKPVVVIDTAWKALAYKFTEGNFTAHAFAVNAYFGFLSRPISLHSDIKEFHGKEIFFYTCIALLLIFAFIRLAFMKYVSDLFQVAFRTTMKQRQIGEQLIQTPLPSLLLNLFFLTTGSFYLGFVLVHYNMTTPNYFWISILYSFLFLSVMYLIKFITLKFSGWLFNISDTTNTYVFIVFMMNKIMGIFLLPFIVLFAFTQNGIFETAFRLCYIGVFALFAYRIILAYGLVRNQIRANPFQFFLYLCAFEIAPLLLIYKVLILWLEKSS